MLMAHEGSMLPSKRGEARLWRKRGTGKKDRGQSSSGETLRLVKDMPATMLQIFGGCSRLGHREADSFWVEATVVRVELVLGRLASIDFF